MVAENVQFTNVLQTTSVNKDIGATLMMAVLVRQTISKDWSYFYETLFSKLSDEGFRDMWSIGAFLVIFIFCTIVITLTLAVAFSWMCGWCLQTSTTRSAKVGVWLPPPEQRPTQAQMGLESVQTQTGLFNLSRQMHTQTSMDPQHPISVKVLKPKSVFRVQKTKARSNNKKLKAKNVKVKRKSPII
ncbi:hypothetical protein DPEC_G00147840 [Dallia pectoralis]|uniref:Uncharacterized protein n=1 Tax=Dallia pectoralis TaxID=75939 RepID=A0ACC2GI93_DALPE|nr:hypothetical protein DPEC_G00147840 [Dallia pectoralis]